MATGYQEFPLTEPFITSHPKLMDNDRSALSLNAGTEFPTTGVMNGMPCYRTDEDKIYIRRNGKWSVIVDPKIAFILNEDGSVSVTDNIEE